jgi:hypothetical protein
MVEMQTDIEVLKTEVRALQAGVSEVAAKLDIVMTMQVQIVRLQEQHDGQRQAVDRAFASIREQSEKINEFHRMSSFLKGGALVAAVLFSFVQWYVIGQVRTLEQVNTDLKHIDRRMLAIEAKLWPESAGGGK